MKRELRRIATVVSLISVTAILSACGGSSSNDGGNSSLYTGKTDQATISTQSVKDALASVKEVIPSCNATGVTKVVVNDQTNRVLSVIKLAQRTLPPVTAKRVVKSTALFSPNVPAATTGTCGGTMSFPTYSHNSGTTTVSVKWDNYCTSDSSGNKTTINGTLNAVDAGTPSASGPVTTKLTANIPILSVVEKNAQGVVIAHEDVALNGFEYVPSSGASISNLSGTAKFTSFEVKDFQNNKAYKLENVNISSSQVGVDTQLSVSGRIFRGTSGYTDLSTDTPIIIDPNKNLKSGAISFTGAGGHKATLTVVPGTGQTFTVAVDGTAVSGAQLQCNGL